MTIFEKIINREIPSYIVWEDDKHIAILDINPVQPGHTLVMPKVVTDYLFDMNDTEYSDLMLATKEVANILKEKLSCKRVCVIIEGYEIPHVHVKLIPTNSPRDLVLNNDLAERPINHEALQETLVKILRMY